MLAKRSSQRIGLRAAGGNAAGRSGRPADGFDAVAPLGSRSQNVGTRMPRSATAPVAGRYGKGSRRVSSRREENKMRIWITVWLLAALACASAQTNSEAVANLPAQKIGPNDLIAVSV